MKDGKTKNVENTLKSLLRNCKVSVASFQVSTFCPSSYRFLPPLRAYHDMCFSSKVLVILVLSCAFDDIRLVTASTTMRMWGYSFAIGLVDPLGSGGQKFSLPEQMDINASDSARDGVVCSTSGQRHKIAW